MVKLVFRNTKRGSYIESKNWNESSTNRASVRKQLRPGRARNTF